MDWFLYDNGLRYLSEWAPRRSFNFVLSEEAFIRGGRSFKPGGLLKKFKVDTS